VNTHVSGLYCHGRTRIAKPNAIISHAILRAGGLPSAISPDAIAVHEIATAGSERRTV
jgi:hypothetical protein